MRELYQRIGQVALAVASAGLVAGCGADTETSPDVTSADASAASDAGADTIEESDADVVDPTVCPDGLPLRAWESGETGVNRRDLVGDFTVQTIDGATFNLAEAWTGCDSFIFLPDQVPVSQADATSVWESDVAQLLADSPPNVHYFFVSTRSRQASAQGSLDGVQDQFEQVLAGMDEADFAHWLERVHVVDTASPLLENWLKETFAGAGRQGFAIDRYQRIRGIGSFADVTRYDEVAAAQEAWPWTGNLANAAQEALFFNAEAEREQWLQSFTDTEIVNVYDGEILAGFDETSATLPDAATMATFDRLLVDVEQLCPDATIPEFGNCGAWDYLAHLYLIDGETRIEMARFITTYHREGRFVVDATPMLAYLQEGGERDFRWEFAPEWNTQPTATRVRLRFIRTGSTTRPRELFPLWTGGTFNAEYNNIQEPVTVTIPADATRVEFWAIITGHGSEASSCAEFCNHQHEVRIGETILFREHETVGDQQGCMAEVENGMTPNQWGTWWFGRGGWCPGQQVEPWREDVTADVVPGQEVTLRYAGLLNGLTPREASGNIRMTSFLVVYTDEP
jgi:hypothetical protein